MGKVFMITEGLENMGALKTGGQGSVYKGRRIGDIISAVKILPTPIYKENSEDKNYLDFKNEVEKLKRVNEVPNPNVVKIFNYGITESGNFPFIEMEFIEGPDLEELLESPHDPVYSVKGAIKVAEQLANALAHCHRVDVKHGDIKSNNVKYNIHTANYVLLDFGMAVMSDEQRRTSLRHAGAIEFMAPEQNEGIMLFESDVYSYGIVLFEILAGRVPFPLNDKGETSRHAVMVSHMEAPLPDLLELRRENMPAHWDEVKRNREMQLPHWLTEMIYKCLEKTPENRFRNGIELFEYIQLNATLAAQNEESRAEHVMMLEGENERLWDEKERLQALLIEKENELRLKDKKIKDLETLVSGNASSNTYEGVERQSRSRKGISKPSLLLLFFIIGLVAFAAISFFKNSKSNELANNDAPIVIDSASSASENSVFADTTRKTEEVKKPVATKRKTDSPQRKQELPQVKERQTSNAAKADATEIQKEKEEIAARNNNEDNSVGKYKLASRRVYFHNEPDESTRRNAFIVHWNNATLTALEEKNGFIYVVFTNHLGQTSKGWLPKKDLKLVD